MLQKTGEEQLQTAGVARRTAQVGLETVQKNEIMSGMVDMPEQPNYSSATTADVQPIVTFRENLLTGLFGAADRALYAKTAMEKYGGEITKRIGDARRAAAGHVSPPFGPLAGKRAALEAYAEQLEGLLEMLQKHASHGQAAASGLPVRTPPARR